MSAKLQMKKLNEATPAEGMLVASTGATDTELQPLTFKASAVKWDISDGGGTSFTQTFSATTVFDVESSGSISISNELSMGENGGVLNKITNMANPVDDQDAATKIYVDGLGSNYDAAGSAAAAQLAAENNASADATTKADNAQDAAELTAAADATTKADNAQAAAELTAANAVAAALVIRATQDASIATSVTAEIAAAQTAAENAAQLELSDEETARINSDNALDLRCDEIVGTTISNSDGNFNIGGFDGGTWAIANGNVDIKFATSIAIADTCTMAVCEINSDRRLKENIEDIDTEKALVDISKLQPKEYNLIKYPDAKRWGFIAQSMQGTPLEHLVVGEETEDTYLGVNYLDLTAMIPVLCQKILALEEKISKM